MHVRLICDSKLAVGVSVRMHDYLICLCGPVMDWRHVQAGRPLLTDDRWVRLQPSSATQRQVWEIDGRISYKHKCDFKVTGIIPMHSPSANKVTAAAVYTNARHQY